MSCSVERWYTSEENSLHLSCYSNDDKLQLKQKRIQGDVPGVLLCPCLCACVDVCGCENVSSNYANAIDYSLIDIITYAQIIIIRLIIIYQMK